MTGASTSSQGELEGAYAVHRELLLHFLIRKMKCRYAAEDVVQDVFLAIRRTTSVSLIVNKKAFLFRVAANLATNRFTQEARRRELREANAAILWTVIDEVTPERSLLGVQALDAVDRAIESLPERTRRILAWRRMDGLTNREIAIRLHISETAVERHMRVAMRALVGALEDDDFSG